MIRALKKEVFGREEKGGGDAGRERGCGGLGYSGIMMGIGCQVQQ